MAQPKPAVMSLSEMMPGQSGDFFALLAEKSRNARRDGKPFFTCRFRDARRTATLMVWADGPWFELCEHDWKEGQFYKIRAAYDEHKTYGPQIEPSQIRPVKGADKDDGFDPLDFVECSRLDRAAMFIELRGLAEAHIADAGLRHLTLTLLDRHAAPLQQLPATPRHFYPFCGGLLEHTLSVTKNCLWLAEKYAAQYVDLRPALNKDLVVAGAILHDIGRVLELADDPVSPQPTVPGRFFGHLLLGRDLVRDTAREFGDVDPELVQMLEHIVVSHLSLPEWGSPRLPLIPEVLILHHADDLDAKFEMYARCLSRDQETGPFTARDPILGRPLYKGQSSRK